MRLSGRQSRSATHRVDDIADCLEWRSKPRVIALMKLYAGQHRLATQIHPRVRVGFVFTRRRGAAENRRGRQYC